MEGCTHDVQALCFACYRAERERSPGGGGSIDTGAARVLTFPALAAPDARRTGSGSAARGRAHDPALYESLARRRRRAQIAARHVVDQAERAEEMARRLAALELPAAWLPFLDPPARVRRQR